MPPVTNDDDAEAGIRFIASIFARMEIEPWGLNGHNRRLALACPIAREYMRQRHQSPGQGGLLSLTAIWRVAGEPMGKSPAEWLADPDNGYPDQETEERDGAWWADYQTAAWFLEAVSKVVEVVDVLEMCY
jgi:hypothetical protein